MKKIYLLLISIFTFGLVQSYAQSLTATHSYTVNSNNTVSYSCSPSGGFPPYSYSWSFDVTNPGASYSVQNPTHTYSNPGTYVIHLIITDFLGDFYSYQDSIHVNTCNSYFTKLIGSNGMVNFTNQSTPLSGAVTFGWDFGDNNVSNVTNPTHNYVNAGIYPVTLSLYDTTSNCQSSYTDSINVSIGTPSSCNASFNKVKDSSVAFGVVLYNTSSNFGSHFYTWDFGDGITGSGRTPIHQYQNFGSYVVCLTITDSILNCTSTYCDTVGIDSLGNLKTGFGLRVVNPTSVGLTEVNDLNSVNLFPNPATNQIALDLTSVQSSLNIRILDISGRIVMEQLNQNPGMVKNFEIASLESGLYFMVLNNGSSQEIKKFIKQ